MQVLLLSTPVGPIGSGIGGGVELTVANLARALQLLGHGVEVLAPKGSRLEGVPLTEITGRLHPNAQHQEPDVHPSIPPDSVLAAMCDHARQTAERYDLLLNLAYDWLPFYLTPFYKQPVAHLVSMSRLGTVMAETIVSTQARHRGSVAVHTHAQAATYSGLQDYCCIGNGIDLDCYHYQPEPDREPALAWAGRIAPEKGLEHALEAARRAGISLQIMGKIQDKHYWQRLCSEYPEAIPGYAGFLPTPVFQEQLGHCHALVMTPSWIEAFGNVAIEALACGLPVISYRNGGPAEIIADGETGWLVEPQDVDGLVAAIARIGEIDRSVCRRNAEKRYSLPAFGARIEAWLMGLLPEAHPPVRERKRQRRRVGPLRPSQQPQA